MLSFLGSYFKSQLFTSLPVPSHSFSGQTIIVTGSNTGLGLEAARHFVRLDANKVILAVRDVQKGDEAANSIVKSTGRVGVIEVWEVDLANYSSVKAFALRATQLQRLDVVVENAGILTHDFSTAENNERTITINVLSTVLLGLLLLPKLRQTSEELDKDVVLTFTGSFVHWLTAFPERMEHNILEGLAVQDTARMNDRYNVSKLIELLIVRELARRVTESQRSRRIIISIANPGSVITTLNRSATGFKKTISDGLKPLLFRNADEGSRTIVFAAAGQRETHGQYLNDCKIGIVSSWVQSEDGLTTQKRLWEEVSAELSRIQAGIKENI